MATEKTDENTNTKPRRSGYPHKPRPATYYKLTENDWPTIIDGLKHYASVYHIALKIGCGYNTLKTYIHKHPKLLAVQKDAKASIDEFVESQIVRKCASGYFPALAFYAERKMGWTQHQTIENVGALPTIMFGLIPESKLPPIDNGEEVKRLEAEYLQGDKQADIERKDAQESVADGEGVEDETESPDIIDAEYFGITAEPMNGEGQGMFGV